MQGLVCEPHFDSGLVSVALNSNSCFVHALLCCSLDMPVRPTGNNPIMLIGTKVDLLPAGSKPEEIAEWLRAFAAFKRISAVSVHLVSSSCCCLPVGPAEGAVLAVPAGRAEAPAWLPCVGSAMRLHHSCSSTMSLRFAC